jgi:hypothetical protein
VNIFKGIVSAEIPLIGIEPSAVLTFRDDDTFVSLTITSAEN